MTRRNALTAGGGALLLLLGVLLGHLLTGRDGPSEVDTGFARDMTTHHQQAVLMAGLALEQSEDPEIQTLAFDILTTQNAQVGQMQGWLAAWGEPTNSSEAPMAWTGHAPANGQMPGMATGEEIAQLRSLAGPAFDTEFLQLMRAHHEGGVHMAEAAADGDRPEVRDLAEKILDAQTAEIETLESMLASRSESSETHPPGEDSHHN